MKKEKLKPKKPKTKGSFWNGQESMAIFRYALEQTSGFAERTHLFRTRVMVVGISSHLVLLSTSMGRTVTSKIAQLGSSYDDKTFFLSHFNRILGINTLMIRTNGIETE
jgi:hypothetical protein